MPQRPSTSIRFNLLPLLISLLLPLAAPAQEAADRSLAQHVPPDVGIFAELRAPDELLTILAEPRLWTSLAEIAGQPARPEETQRWKQIIEDTVRMTPQAAIEDLCAGGIAFVGAGVGRSQDAVVITRPKNARPETLIAGWDARRVEIAGTPSTWWLRRIGVTVHQDMLIFGDLLPPKGMFRHVAETLHAEPRRGRLSDATIFKALRRKLPPNPDGLLYARLGKTIATTQPVRPASLLVADHIMVGLQREGRRLHLTAIGDPSSGTEPSPGGAPADAARLPRETLFAWEANVDYAQLGAQVERLPDDHFAQLALRLLPPDASLPLLLESLAGRTTLALGHVARPADSSLPPIPAIGLTVALSNPEQARYCIEEMAGALQLLYGSMSLARGLPALPTATTRKLGGAEIHVLDLSALLPADDETLRGALRISWTVTDETLLLATHDAWLEQMLAAQRGAVPNLAGTLQLAQRAPTSAAGNVIVLQAGAVSRIGQTWLDYLARNDAEVLTEKWWRDRQESAGRLGIDVAQDRTARSLTIRSVQRGRPAEGFLNPGDAIVGCNGRRFRTDEPIKEIRAAIESRPAARWVELLVERDGVLLPIRVPLPFINPVDTLQRLVAFGRVADAVVYHDQGPYGHLTLLLSE